MKEKIEFRKVRDFDRSIGDTLLFIKQNFKPLFKSTLYLCGFFILAGMVSSMITQLQIYDLTDNFDNGNYSENVSSWSTLYGWRYFLVIIFAILNYTALSASVLSFVALYVAKGNVAPTVEEVWSYFKYYFFKMLWAGILVAILWTICFFFCFFPGVYVTPAFYIVYAVMVLENEEFSAAFSRSFTLVKNNWWMTFATIFVVLIITVACTTIVMLPSYVLTMVGTFTHHEAGLQRGYQIFLSVSQSISQLFLVIPLVSAAVIYYSLVERKESVGLLVRIADFGKPQEEVHHPEEEDY